MMGLEELRGRRDILARIDWEITPLEAVEMFDHRAGGLKSKLQVRSPGQKYYFFCVDNWQGSPRLLLKERSVKESITLAELPAPKDLLEECVLQYGGRKGLFPPSEALNLWLRENLFRQNT